MFKPTLVSLFQGDSGDFVFQVSFPPHSSYLATLPKPIVLSLRFLFARDYLSNSSTDWALFFFSSRITSLIL